MFIYCTESERKRIEAARKAARQTVSGYVMQAVMDRVERDERKVTSPR